MVTTDFKNNEQDWSMTMKRTAHIIKDILEDSIAGEMGIEAGDALLAINGQNITDIFDYQYLIQDEYIEVLIRKSDGEEWLLEIDKDYEEDLGVEFENGLMDDYRSCRNKCIFCFIDQMPKGMRETLYFKDDDSRLSFLQGNYVTLTNMSDEDIERVIRYHLSPINISFQTTNPELRCKMLHNRFAGEALAQVKKLYDAGIAMNGQIVLCKGVNDGAELERSISDLTAYLPHLESVSVVPVGLSRFRDGLYPLEPFEKEDAVQVLNCIHKWQEELFPKYGLHFVHASDEWYILAEQELPEEERYDGYLQLENGVGMLRLLINEFEEAMEELPSESGFPGKSEELSLVTGKLAYPYIKRMADRMMQRFDGLSIHVYDIKNFFFGERITVSGLLTGQDIIGQLRGKKLGERILLPQNVLRSGEDYFLDDITVAEMEKALQVKVDIVKSSGREFVNVILRLNEE
jgi:putative radical SAM enzyme (TIGR03279 family)